MFKVYALYIMNEPTLASSDFSPQSTHTNLVCTSALESY